jgi:hypothetical protein
LELITTLTPARFILGQASPNFGAVTATFLPVTGTLSALSAPKPRLGCRHFKLSANR